MIRLTLQEITIMGWKSFIISVHLNPVAAAHLHCKTFKLKPSLNTLCVQTGLELYMTFAVMRLPISSLFLMLSSSIKLRYSGSFVIIPFGVC